MYVYIYIYILLCNETRRNHVLNVLFKCFQVLVPVAWQLFSFSQDPVSKVALSASRATLWLPLRVVPNNAGVFLVKQHDSLFCEA